MGANDRPSFAAASGLRLVPSGAASRSGVAASRSGVAAVVGELFVGGHAADAAQCDEGSGDWKEFGEAGLEVREHGHASTSDQETKRDPLGVVSLRGCAVRRGAYASKSMTRNGATRHVWPMILTAALRIVEQL
jgi:hypothetical protein